MTKELPCLELLRLYWARSAKPKVVQALVPSGPVVLGAMVAWGVHKGYMANRLESMPDQAKWQLVDVQPNQELNP